MENWSYERDIHYATTINAESNDAPQATTDTVNASDTGSRGRHDCAV
jgi:hypothetical protein